MSRAGRKDRQITIQEPTQTEAADNTPITTYVDLVTVWAEKMPAVNLERYRVQQTVLVDDLVFRIYYLPAITALHRIVFDGENYDIRGIKEIGRKEDQEILARRVTPNAG